MTDKTLLQRTLTVPGSFYIVVFIFFIYVILYFQNTHNTVQKLLDCGMKHSKSNILQKKKKKT